MLDTVKRRLDLLKLEGEGFSYSEIVKGLSEKYGCTPRTVKYDFALRGKWQPQYLDIGDVQKIVMKAANRFDAIYIKAAFKARHAQNDSTELRALDIMRQANRDFLETLLPNRSKMEVEITLPRPFVIKKWRREHADSPETE